MPLSQRSLISLEGSYVLYPKSILKTKKLKSYRITSYNVCYTKLLRYLYESQTFFERHGGKAIIFARFLPIIRTFVPIIAGIVHMKKTRFMFYNVLSSVMWSFILVFAGHYLYGLFLEEFDLDLKKHIEKIIFILIAITTFPLLMKAIKSAKNKSRNNFV